MRTGDLLELAGDRDFVGLEEKVVRLRVGDYDLGVHDAVRHNGFPVGAFSV